MPVAIALLAGALATLNPCGFALLPAYLSLYVGAQEEDLPGAPTRLLQGVVVGLTVTAGFLGIFAVLGVPIALGAGRITRSLPWIGILIGVVMAVVAVVTLAGRQIKVPIRGLRPGRQEHRATVRMLVFGVGYGLTSLGCTMPIFLVVVGTSLTTNGTLAALSVFGAYAIGMAVVLMALAIGAALLRDGVARALRHALPHLRWINGGLLLLVSVYLTYYWGSTLFASADFRAQDPVVGSIERLTSFAQTSADSGGGRWFVAGAAVVVAAGTLIGVWQWVFTSEKDEAQEQESTAGRKRKAPVAR